MSKENEISVRYCSFCGQPEVKDEYIPSLYDYFEKLICLKCILIKSKQRRLKMEKGILECRENIQKLESIHNELDKARICLQNIAKKLKKG